MHQNKPGMYTNNLSSHASLLLSASPTIITSPLQNNSNNNPQSSPVTPSIALVRRQSSTPLLLAASNLDNDSHTNNESPSNNAPIEGYINFKKPQNEMFKKLDGKIQEIVAAHSNLNKLYALNDFSTLGVGPKKPSELPGQLPRPPPCIPKVTGEHVSQSNDDSNLNDTASTVEMADFRPHPSIFNPNRIMKPSNKCSSPGKTKSPSLTIDSAISKLHQKLQQKQQLQQQMGTKQTNFVAELTPKGPLPSSSASNRPTPTINPAQFTLLAQKIKETLETERAANNRGDILSNEDKKKFQENLIAMLKREISAVTKSAQIRFSTTPDTKAKIMKQKSLLMKSSPQTLFNTIRRETSLLLNKREQQVGRSSLSLLSDQQTLNRQHPREHQISANTIRYPINKLQQTIKVIVPPIECHQPPKSSESLDESSNARELNLQKPMEESASSKVPVLTYQVIRNKLRLFQENNRIYLGRLHKSPYGSASRSSPTKAKKSLDKIVDRLQAKWSSLPMEVDIPTTGNQKAASLQQQIIYSSASLLKTSRNTPAISAPTPIPVFRLPLAIAGKGGYLYSSSGSSKVVNMKSKKSKRFLPFGLKIGNYLEKESPQPTTEKITKEQFANCLNLVRSNDVSLQRHQEQLSQSEPKWRLPVGDRPLRLRRIRGDRIHMPASASYRATRKVGLQ